ncbi:MAG: aminoacyl-tRNA hydrolase [Clostridiales bacterium]|nr:aminoacyl-tRNA hydrolase [Clostridiales bacterium]
MWLITGLGNPGAKYYKNWHNMGFLAIDLLAEKHGIVIGKSKFQGEYGKGKIEGQDVILLKPFTYMNNSGISVAECAKFFKIEPKNIIIMYDDIDIARGKIRVRTKGSAGSHNGMKSVIEHLGTTEFPRVRIGTGPVPEHWDLIDYVLSNVPEDQRVEVFDSFGDACDAVKDLINGKYDNA